jgi:hypothetical protein
VRVCGLNYPGQNGHAPFYIAICGLSDYTVPHKRHGFGEKDAESKMCFDFLSNFV